MPHASLAEQEMARQLIELGTVSKDFRERYEAKFLDLQSQVDAIDERRQAIRPGGAGGAAIGGKAITDALEKHLEQFRTGGRVKFEVDTHALLQKSTLLSTGLY